jgi:hypothetical protein
VLILLIAAVAGLFAAAQDPLRGWKVNAKTGALALVAVEESPREITFLFRNVSGRMITGWAFSFGADDQRRRTDYRERFGGATEGLAPGEVDRLSIGSQEVSEYTERAVETSAVIFADGGSEGSPDLLSNMNYWRLGWMLETERVKRVLNADGARKAQMDDANLAILIQKIGTLPESPAEAVASVQEERLPGVAVAEIRRADSQSLRHFLSGVREARERGVRKLEQLGSLPVLSSEPKTRSRASVFSRLRQEYEGLSAKYRAYCEHTRGGTRQ